MGQVARSPVALLELGIVQDEAFNDELAQSVGRPDAKVRGLEGIDPVTHRDDGIEVVVGDAVSFTVGRSCFQNGNNCRLHQLPALEDVFEVLADRRRLNPKKVRHHLLREPEIIACEEHIGRYLAVGALVEHHSGGRLVGIGCGGHGSIYLTRRREDAKSV